MKTGRIRQTVTFHGLKPLQVYDLLMNAKKHSAFTGSKVTLSTKLNGKFRVFDGYCTGFNIDLKEGKKIVQGWHFKEEGWPEDHFSICTFLFAKAPNGTKLTFTQSGIPAHKVDSLKTGWKEFYWEPMKTYLAK
jgi:activator of HSP90 ATPase